MKLLTLMFITLLSHAAWSLELTSKQLQDHGFMSKAQEFIGFGCKGENLSPELTWSDAPEGTKSFAITVYDPDAPTGSGWWHWQVYNLPASVNRLKAGIASDDLPKGAAQGTNDYGVKAFGGACPPKDHGVHHYEFTVYAIKEDKLDIPDGASAALIGYMLNANALAKHTLTALYKR